MLTFVVAAELAAVAALTNRIDFIDEDTAGRLFLCLLKQVAHTGGAHAHEHFYKFTAANREERHLRFTSHSLGQQCFTGARRAHEQCTLGHISADGLVLAGVMQKVHQLHQGFLGLVLTGHIGKAFASLCFHIHLGIALAKGHGIAAHTLAHEVHKELS